MGNQVRGQVMLRRQPWPRPFPATSSGRRQGPSAERGQGCWLSPSVPLPASPHPSAWLSVQALKPAGQFSGCESFEEGKGIKPVSKQSRSFRSLQAPQMWRPLPCEPWGAACHQRLEAPACREADGSWPHRPLAGHLWASTRAGFREERPQPTLAQCGGWFLPRSLSLLSPELPHVFTPHLGAPSSGLTFRCHCPAAAERKAEAIRPHAPHAALRKRAGEGGAGPGKDGRWGTRAWKRGTVSIPSGSGHSHTLPVSTARLYSPDWHLPSRLPRVKCLLSPPFCTQEPAAQRGCVSPEGHTACKWRTGLDTVPAALARTLCSSLGLS